MPLSAVGGVLYLKIKHNRSLVFFDFHSRLGCNRRVKLFWFWSIVLVTCKGDHFRSLKSTFRSRNSLYLRARCECKAKKEKKFIRFTFRAGSEAIVQPNQAHDATTTDFYSWDGERRCFVRMYAARRIQRSRFVYVHERKYLSAAGVLHESLCCTLRHNVIWDISERFFDVAQMPAAGREKHWQRQHLKILREIKSSTSFDWIFVYFFVQAMLTMNLTFQAIFVNSDFWLPPIGVSTVINIQLAGVLQNNLLLSSLIVSTIRGSMRLCSHIVNYFFKNTITKRYSVTLTIIFLATW